MYAETSVFKLGFVVCPFALYWISRSKLLLELINLILWKLKEGVIKLMRKEYSEKKNSEYSLYESSSRLKGCKSI